MISINLLLSSSRKPIRLLERTITPHIRSKFTSSDLKRGKDYYVPLLKKLGLASENILTDDEYEEEDEVPFTHKLEVKQLMNIREVDREADRIAFDEDSQHLHEIENYNCYEKRKTVKPWFKGTPIENLDPLKVKSPDELLFYNVTKNLKYDPERFFLWVAGLFDAAGYIYFSEEIPRDSPSNEDVKNMDIVEPFLTQKPEHDKGMLVPDRLPYYCRRTSSDIYREKCKEYKGLPEEMGSYRWPHRVVEILFPSYEVCVAYYLKLMIRYSYVVKTEKGLWAWRCGDDRGLARLARMLKGRLKTQYSILSMERLCHELKMPSLFVMPNTINISKNCWLVGFLESTMRLKYDFIKQKPYVSIVWRDENLLKAISSKVGPGYIREYVHNTVYERTSLDNNVSIFTDYRNELISSDFNAKNESFDKSLTEKYWEITPFVQKADDNEYMNNIINEINSNRYNLRTFKTSPQYSKVFFPTSSSTNDNKLLELIIDDMRGMSKIYELLIYNNTESYQNVQKLGWHGIMASHYSNCYDGNVSTDITRRNIAHLYSSTTLWEDINLDTILLKRSLPKYSLYNCYACTENVWIKQMDEKIIADYYGISIHDDILHPQGKENEVTTEHNNLVTVHYKIKESLISNTLNYSFSQLGDAHINKEPIGMAGATRIASGTINPIHRNSTISDGSIKKPLRYAKQSDL